jgi:anti-anti-sigma regulatory factor
MAKAASREQIPGDLDPISSELPKGASVEDLLRLRGTLDKQSAQEIRRAVEEHCERVDPHAW